jgi:hypothetical protein
MSNYQREDPGAPSKSEAERAEIIYLLRVQIRLLMEIKERLQQQDHAIVTTRLTKGGAG